MNYQKLFEISIIHDYYRDKICSDVTLEPTVETQQLFRNYHLLFRQKINGLLIIAPVNSAGNPLLEFSPDLAFTFVLHLKNQQFSEFTQFDSSTPLTAQGSSIHYFTNEENTKDQLLKYQRIARNQLNLPLAPNIFGLAKIVSHSSFNSEYNIKFLAKKHYWYYYIITDKDYTETTFLIEDIENQNNKFIPTQLTATQAQSIQKIVSAQFPNKQLYLFKSDAAIACQQQGRKNIQLIKQSNGNGTTVWIESLPNPPNATGIQIINLMKSV